ncbi:hypothetical protein [Chitinophaga sp. GbtcB8]|uniref:hypothetical protein n=1 Tax=Chitinophaga sp. GbtcB8 TaxID=2824753 RepID=UPI001C3053D2|nr:hypothetical protein [Chitinophaga sp. GbtcB8]
MRKLNLPCLLVAGAFAGMFFMASCGNGQNTSTDSTGTISSDSNMMMSDTSSVRDTAPAAEQPPGAINPGEDSSRYGTGTQDSSKNRRKNQ